MYVEMEEAPVFGAGNEAFELPVKQIEAVPQEGSVPAGVVLRFSEGAVFTSRDNSRVMYDPHKGCTPSTVLLFAAGDLYVKLTAPVSVGYDVDGKLRIASSADPSVGPGGASADGQSVSATSPVGFDMMCNVRTVVQNPAAVSVQAGALVDYYSVPEGIDPASLPPLVKTAAPEPPVVVVPVTPADLGPCPEGQWRAADESCVPLVSVRPAPAKPWYKRASTWLAVGSVVVVGGVVIAATRRG